MDPFEKIFDAKLMDRFVLQAAKLPLAHEPGARFSYGINTDILGAVVEKISPPLPRPARGDNDDVVPL